MGRQRVIRAGIAECPFGECLIGESSLGICHLSLFDPGDSAESIREMQEEWPGAEIVWDHAQAAVLSQRIFSRNHPESWNVHVRGTPFQLRVWQALLGIPCGKVMPYGALAAGVGKPTASRATGSAVGANEVSFLIPCHRVTRADGSIGQYRWGAERKASILKWEAEGTI